MQFDSQVKVVRTAQSAYTITFARGADLHTIKGKLTPAWPGVKCYVGSEEVGDGTLFAFTNPVTVVAKADLFGYTELTETLVLTPEIDKPGDAQLLTLALRQADNEGLTADVADVPIGDRLVIAVPADKGTVKNPSKVKLDFTLAGVDSKLLNGSEVVKAGETELDLTQPRVLTVVAANGNTKEYEIHLQLGQTVSWSLDKTAFTYGDAPVDVMASSSAALPLTFTSTHGEVASVNGGKLFIGTPGSTTITAIQQGTGLYPPTQGPSYTITVGKQTVSVKPATPDVKLGSRAEWQFSYTPLVKPEDAVRMPNPFSREAYKLLQGTEEYEPAGLLPIGSYTLKAGNRYETDCYVVTPEDGSLRVVQGELWQVELRVENEAKSPIAKAAVQIDGQTGLTDAEGMSYLLLPAGKLYRITGMADGYSPASIEVDLTEGSSQQATITLRATTHTLAYSAGEHGTLQGNTAQRVAPGADATPVLAVPEDGYAFTEWSDGSKENPRQERSVQNDIQAVAKFTKPRFRLSYTPGVGGLLHGETAQEVDCKGSGTMVISRTRCELLLHAVERWLCRRCPYRYRCGGQHLRNRPIRPNRKPSPLQRL